jgi:hypothetical protein
VGFLGNLDFLDCLDCLDFLDCQGLVAMAVPGLVVLQGTSSPPLAVLQERWPVALPALALVASLAPSPVPLLVAFLVLVLVVLVAPFLVQLLVGLLQLSPAPWLVLFQVLPWVAPTVLVFVVLALEPPLVLMVPGEAPGME